jgi:hypothetical protein
MVNFNEKWAKNIHIIPNLTFKKNLVKRILPLVMALFQGIKKLFGPLLDDLDCVSDVKEAIELQVEACM